MCPPSMPPQRIGKGDHVLASTDSAKKGVVVGEEGRGYVLAVRLRTLDTQVSLFVRWNDAPAAGPQIGSTVTAISMDSTKRYCVQGAPAGEQQLGFISAGDRLKIVKVIKTPRVPAEFDRLA